MNGLPKCALDGVHGVGVGVGSGPAPNWPPSGASKVLEETALPPGDRIRGPQPRGLPRVCPASAPVVGDVLEGDGAPQAARASAFGQGLRGVGPGSVCPGPARARPLGAVRLGEGSPQGLCVLLLWEVWIGGMVRRGGVPRCLPGDWGWRQGLLRGGIRRGIQWERRPVLHVAAELLGCLQEGLRAVVEVPVLCLACTPELLMLAPPEWAAGGVP
mmetsp:Transcript_63329/g.112940  ORF Transcript_63329/g.112940 Transcript_63329/m.112940 type:complete len:215 (-) Transcript_63329:329-973(-)